MNTREYMLSLYEIYKSLLSTKEREYFEYYYYEDYSLQEIADNYNVSKSYVSKLINTIESKLKEYESLLNINNKYSEIKKVINDLDDSIKSKIENIIEK